MAVELERLQTSRRVEGVVERLIEGFLRAREQLDEPH